MHKTRSLSRIMDTICTFFFSLSKFFSKIRNFGKKFEFRISKFFSRNHFVYRRLKTVDIKKKQLTLFSRLSLFGFFFSLLSSLFSLSLLFRDDLLFLDRGAHSSSRERATVGCARLKSRARVCVRACLSVRVRAFSPRRRRVRGQKKTP